MPVLADSRGISDFSVIGCVEDDFYYWRIIINSKYTLIFESQPFNSPATLPSRDVPTRRFCIVNTVDCY